MTKLEAGAPATGPSCDVGRLLVQQPHLLAIGGSGARPGRLIELHSFRSCPDSSSCPDSTARPHDRTTTSHTRICFTSSTEQTVSTPATPRPIPLHTRRSNKNSHRHHGLLLAGRWRRDIVSHSCRSLYVPHDPCLCSQIESQAQFTDPSLLHRHALHGQWRRLQRRGIPRIRISVCLGRSGHRIVYWSVCRGRSLVRIFLHTRGNAARKVLV